jgi:hypothetical protein
MDIAILIFTILACLFAGISAIPILQKFYVSWMEKKKRERYHFRIFDIDSQETAKKIKDLLNHPENIDYASLSCPKYDNVIKIDDPIIKDYRDYYANDVHEKFRHVLKYLTQKGVLNTFLFRGMIFNDVLEIVRNYMKYIMYTKEQIDNRNLIRIEIYKNIIIKNVKKTYSFSFKIDESKISEDKMIELRALMSDTSIFNHEDLIKIVYPEMLIAIGNDNYPLEIAPKILFLSDYNVRLC